MNTIYCFTNLINNKKYVGSTISKPNVRYNQHIYNAFHKNTHQYNYPLYQAIRKYGIINFQFSILEQKNCSEEEIRKIEKEYIIKLNTLSPNGYNQTLDTQHPINAIESYQKMSNTKRESAKKVAEIDNNKQILNIWRSIVDCSEETLIGEKHIAACCRGERHTAQGRIFCWIDKNNNLLIPEYTGYHYKGAKGTTQIQSTSTAVQKIDLNTEQILAEYPTIALAARENNCDSSAISKVCRGLRKKCGGYFWKYANK